MEYYCCVFGPLMDTSRLTTRTLYSVSLDTHHGMMIRAGTATPHAPAFELVINLHCTPLYTVHAAGGHACERFVRPYMQYGSEGQARSLGRYFSMHPRQHHWPCAMPHAGACVCVSRHERLSVLCFFTNR
jgi:hypothetical protein